jgi:hypothetical protein
MLLQVYVCWRRRAASPFGGQARQGIALCVCRLAVQMLRVWLCTRGGDERRARAPSTPFVWAALSSSDRRAAARSNVFCCWRRRLDHES